ncbi:MAG: hypothetical protein II008_08315, partial [Oscillospiraceae bacterium]|nr:hypothetical protein [Oscillospiraceae bacterium]
MLKHVSGPDANGEYTACCPAHEDSTPSMSITCRRSQKDSKERIYVHCHRGCESSQVAAALGLSMQDLIIDPDEPRG